MKYPTCINWFRGSALAELLMFAGLLPGLAQPVIVTQPQAQEVPLGGTSAFWIKATGGVPLTYQWFFNSLANPIAGAKVTGKVAPGWDPPLYTNQDTLPRPDGESQMKEFRPLALGTIKLEKGRGQLTLRALEIPGGYVMDVRRVNLTLRK